MKGQGECECDWNLFLHKVAFTNHEDAQIKMEIFRIEWVQEHAASLQHRSKTTTATANTWKEIYANVKA